MMRREVVLGALVTVAVGVGLCLLPELAEARVGGGQSYNRNPGGGGGGGGGGEVDLLFFLLHLVLRYPAIGVPILILVIGFFVARAMLDRSGSEPRVHRTQLPPRRAPRPFEGVEALQDRRLARPRPAPGLERLRAADPTFSLPVLLDYVVLVHRRSYEALGNRSWSALAPFVAPEAQSALMHDLGSVEAVSEVVVGGVSVTKVERRGEYDHLYVDLESTRQETRTGRTERWLVREQWTFRRLGTAHSPRPEQVERLGCPNCGAAIEVSRMGTCTNCETPITKGQLQWQAIHVSVLGRSPAQVPEVAWSAGGDEASVHLPTLTSPTLDAAMRTLRQQHPEFEAPAFGARVEHVYKALQAAWSATSWDDARPYVTDRMYQTLRFWIERYRSTGLRNQLDDVALERVRIVRIDLDRSYIAVTVRLWGSMRDSVVDSTGTVVGGNADVPRRFSEYWTLLRSADGDAGTKADAAGCPSCGAPLDQINQSGTCGYCDSRITTGRFDWVLARIEQPEAYRG